MSGDQGRDTRKNLTGKNIITIKTYIRSTYNTVSTKVQTKFTENHITVSIFYY